MQSRTRTGPGEIIKGGVTATTSSSRRGNIIVVLQRRERRRLRQRNGTKNVRGGKRFGVDDGTAATETGERGGERQNDFTFFCRQNKLCFYVAFAQPGLFDSFQ